MQDSPESEYERALVREEAPPLGPRLSLALAPLALAVLQTLKAHYQAQEDGGGCGMASAVVVLNTLLEGRNLRPLTQVRSSVSSPWLFQFVG